VGGVKPHKGIRKQNNDKRLGTIAEAVNNLIHKGFQDSHILLAVNQQQGKGQGRQKVGKDIFNAYYKMETLEHFAHIAFNAHLLGNVNTLNKEQVQKLISLREKFGIRKDIGLIPEKEKQPRKNRKE
jgi:hypothetical protein